MKLLICSHKAQTKGKLEASGAATAVVISQPVQPNFRHVRAYNVRKVSKHECALGCVKIQSNSLPHICLTYRVLFHSFICLLPMTLRYFFIALFRVIYVMIEGPLLHGTELVLPRFYYNLIKPDPITRRGLLD